MDYRKAAYQAAVRAGHPDPEMFVRQIGAESGFRPNAGSPAGAVGIAQIMPATAKGWGVDPTDPIASLDAAAKAMAKYIKSYKGDRAKALAAYNAGVGAVAKYGGVPPYAETKNYIKKIMGDSPTTGPVGSTPAATADPSGGMTDRDKRLAFIFKDSPWEAFLEKRDYATPNRPSASATPSQQAAEGKGFFARRKGETGQQYLDRLLQKKFGLKHDAGNSQTTGGKHTAGSRHYAGLATDYGNAKNDPATLQAAEDWVNQNRNQFVGGIAELLYGPDVPGHADHLHVATQRSTKGIKKR